MSKYRQLDLKGITTISIRARKSKVSPKNFARPIDPRTATVIDFIDSLPRILVAEDLRRLVNDIVHARKRKKPVIVMIGAHVIKVGLSAILIDLLKRGVITHVAMNSAAAIHDVETAMWGQTSEDVAVNLLDGTFGMARETGELINKALVKAMTESSDGYGEALAKKLIALKAKHAGLSVLVTCYTRGVPVTVHAAIGTDIVHQQPTMDGAATGEMTFRDFKILAHSVKDLQSGGVVLNIGSAVILPEVFLKALTVARNLGYKARGFTTANFDMIRHYRPQVNVVERPTQQHGRGYSFVGHHEIMVPLLAAMINAKLT
jgi:deoxyhypusine synthase